jgi:hypothetical protein
MQIPILLVQLGMIAVAFGLCGYLFLSVKREARAADRRWRQEIEISNARLSAMEIEISGLKKEFESIPAATAAPPAGSGINMNKRTQALRMMRLGEGPDHIATALSIPRKEVELLVKVQRMLMDTTTN